MKRSERSSRSVRGIVLMLVLAVLLCFALPMMGGSHDAAVDLAAMVCCFVLAIVLTVFMLRRCASTTAVVPLRIDAGARPARGDPVARGPDPITLGMLLI